MKKKIVEQLKTELRPWIKSVVDGAVYEHEIARHTEGANRLKATFDSLSLFNTGHPLHDMQKAEPVKDVDDTKPQVPSCFRTGHAPGDTSRPWFDYAEAIRMLKHRLFVWSEYTGTLVMDTLSPLTFKAWVQEEEQGSWEKCNYISVHAQKQPFCLVDNPEIPSAWDNQPISPNSPNCQAETPDLSTADAILNELLIAARDAHDLMPANVQRRTPRDAKSLLLYLKTLHQSVDEGVDALNKKAELSRHLNGIGQCCQAHSLTTTSPFDGTIHRNIAGYINSEFHRLEAYDRANDANSVNKVNPVNDADKPVQFYGALEIEDLPDHVLRPEKDGRA